MTILDVILFIILALFVVYLVIVAATEPRYKWRSIATFDELMLDMQERYEKFQNEIFLQFIPVLQKAAKAFDDFAEAIGEVDL